MQLFIQPNNNIVILTKCKSSQLCHLAIFLQNGVIFTIEILSLHHGISSLNSQTPKNGLHLIYSPISDIRINGEVMKNDLRVLTAVAKFLSKDCFLLQTNNRNDSFSEE